MDRYQDYVIKDGKFVGKFEEMYQKFDDPWHQSENGMFNNLPRKVVSHFIRQYQIKNSVEFGCGLGNTMSFIQKETNIETLGIDISETSIKKAKKKYPEMSFEVNNIENILDYSQFQCFFFSEITWYLLEDKLLDKVFEKAKTPALETLDNTMPTAGSLAVVEVRFIIRPHFFFFIPGKTSFSN